MLPESLPTKHMYGIFQRKLGWTDHEGIFLNFMKAFRAQAFFAKRIHERNLESLLHPGNDLRVGELLASALDEFSRTLAPGASISCVSIATTAKTTSP